ncbi:acyl-CoA dehydrogenase family protein [Parafrankia elaeagni]|uniref:acyl-CoA dehydrogenase family protein n=1 Tax=Parafrankia elaeagni TaxID=222534 RepID=UPI0003A2D711|nr:acyl-CoA dehydrogenase family protein [Parafrankia elaeagni]
MTDRPGSPSHPGVSTLFPPGRRLGVRHEQLREEVRGYLQDQLAQGKYTPHNDAWLSSWDEDFSRGLGARGYLGTTVPKEYGGQGADALDRYVITEELLASGAPVAAHWIADRQIAPSLLRYGTEAQRHRYLPAISRGESYWGIGLSEPDAGSDLAAVRSKAVRVDGGWELTGRKVWTSGAHHAHAFFALARTGPPEGRVRHTGLSQLIVELDQPGVEIRPIRLLTGAHHFNEVVFDRVFIPDDMVLGTVGDGWRQATSELAFERSGPERYLSTLPLLTTLVGELAAGGDSVRDVDAAMIGAITARVWTLRQMSLAVAGALAQGEVPEVAAALVKDLGTRLEGDIVDIARTVARTEPDPSAPTELPRLLAESILHTPGFTLRGGTNEILRGVVARALGMR